VAVYVSASVATNSRAVVATARDEEGKRAEQCHGADPAGEDSAAQ
jgi:hypothetical protein